MLVLIAALLMPAADPLPMSDELPTRENLPPAAARMIADIETLAAPDLRGRAWPHSQIAGDWVAEQMETIGLQPLFESGFHQTIPRGAADLQGANIGGCIRGSELPDEWVFITAHHDHLGVRGQRMYRGADDNASGVSMVLEAARQFAAGEPPRRSVAFITFDLEEHLLWGSRYFVAHTPIPLDQIKLFLTADMIGRRLGDLPMDEVFVMGTESAAGLADVVQQASSDEAQPVALLATDIVGTRSDYGPFRSKKVPFLFFSTGEHSDYHTPGDIPEKIDAVRAAAIMRVAVAVARDAATRSDPPAWSPQPVDALAEAAVLNRIATLLANRHDSGELPLPLIELLLVRRMQTESHAILDAGVVSPRQRTWLVNGARAMLLSVF